MRDTSRYVDRDGQRLVSVTEALALSGWVRFDGVPWRVLERARERGTWVHEASVLVDDKDLLWEEVPEEYEGYLRAYERFRAEADLEVEHREDPLTHSVYRFAGTCDIAGKLNGEPAVIDIKTSAEPWPWWPIQLAGYSLLLGNGRKRFSLRLRGDGTYRLDAHNDPKDGNLFLAALSNAQALLARGVVKIPEEELRD